MERNLYLPGNPRYQPEVLVPIYGYDNLYRPLIEVELALLDELHACGVIPGEDYAALTPELRENLLSITTTEVDEIENTITHHDVRALVQAMQKRMPPALARWVHLTATSYDILEPARILQLKRAHQALLLQVKQVIETLAERVKEEARTLMIGRTHGQHALPITAGFWLATILSRILWCTTHLENAEKELRGKLSGAVGACNAQTALNLHPREGYQQPADQVVIHLWYEAWPKGGFEQNVLGRLGLSAAMTSTQILAPEPVATYLYHATLLSAALGQLGRDCRQLARTEIGEVAEPFEKGQVGSSTMAQKRNPVTFENIEGMWERNEAEFGKVTKTLVSEHQRDLVGSSVVRDFPVILVNLAQQLSRLTKVRKSTGKSFLASFVIDREACRKNFDIQSHLITAELLYIALAMHGFEGDAHEFVNHVVVPRAKRSKSTSIDLITATAMLAQENGNPHLLGILNSIPESVKEIIRDPTRYTGQAEFQAMQVARCAYSYLGKEW